MKWSLFILILFSLSAHASRDVVSETFEGTTKKQSRAGARQEIFDQAIEKVSFKYIKEIIGETKLEANKDTIKNKIIRNNGKYILFIKSEKSKASKSGTKMTVSLRLSLKSLQKLLLQQGLLYQISGPPMVLPLIRLEDRANGASYAWWSLAENKTGGFLASQAQILHQSLRQDLLPRGFFTYIPLQSGVHGTIPLVFRGEDLPTADQLFLGEYHGGQIVVNGTVQFKKSQKRVDTYSLEIKLVAQHTSNGRVVGEVIRSYETEAGPMNVVVAEKSREVFPALSKDLTVQIHDAWKSGTFGSTLVKLIVSGRMSFQGLASFKDTFLASVPGVKTLKERKFQPGQVTFEIDSDVEISQLILGIQKTKFPNLQVEVSGSNTKEIALRVR